MLVPLSEWRRHRSAHGDRDGSPAGWRKLRAQVIARDGHRCRRCGSSEKQVEARGGVLEVHHRDDDWRNDDPANLETLCDSCHPRTGAPQL